MRLVWLQRVWRLPPRRFQTKLPRHHHECPLGQTACPAGRTLAPLSLHRVGLSCSMPVRVTAAARRYLVQIIGSHVGLVISHLRTRHSMA